jgi:hypothetical protein
MYEMLVFVASVRLIAAQLHYLHYMLLTVLVRICSVEYGYRQAVLALTLAPPVVSSGRPITGVYVVCMRDSWLDLLCIV